MTVVGFALLAAAGAVTRSAVAARWNRRDRPAGTFAVNVAGSLALGILAGTGQATVTAVGVGGLGALTTVSAFAREVTEMHDAGRTGRAAGYVSLTVAGCVSAAAAGSAIAF